MKKIAYIVIMVLFIIALWPRKSGWGTKYKDCPAGFSPYLLNSGYCVKCPMGASPNMYSGCSNINGTHAFGSEERRREKK